MPFITIELLEGRTPEQKKELMEKVHNAVKDALQITDDRIYIFVDDIKKDHYLRGGKLASES